MHGSQIHRQINHADLGAISVANGNFITAFHQIYNGFCGIFHQRLLFLRRISQSIAPQSQHQSSCHLHSLQNFDFFRSLSYHTFFPAINRKIFGFRGRFRRFYPISFCDQLLFNQIQGLLRRGGNKMRMDAIGQLIERRGWRIGREAPKTSPHPGGSQWKALPEAFHKYHVPRKYPAPFPRRPQSGLTHPQWPGCHASP